MGKSNRLWVKVAVDFFDDPKILEAGVHAELLFVRGLAWAKRDNSGFIPRGALIRLMLGLAEDAADRLVSVGLWEREDDGFTISAWSEWQSETVTRGNAGGRGAHQRWHKHGLVEGCRWCEEMTHDLWQTDGKRIARDEMTHVFANAEKENNGHTSSEGFDEFWKAYPKKVAKGDAAKAWKQTARKRPAMPELLAALEAAKAGWRDRQFIPYPASWLRAERWADEQESYNATGAEVRTDPMVGRVLDVVAPLRALGAGRDEAVYALADFPEPYRAAGLAFFDSGVWETVAK